MARVKEWHGSDFLSDRNCSANCISLLEGCYHTKGFNPSMIGLTLEATPLRLSELAHVDLDLTIMFRCLPYTQNQAY